MGTVLKSFLMLSHVFHCPVKRLPVIDLLQIAGKVEMVFVLQFIQQPLPFGVVSIGQEIIERQLPYAVSGQVVNARSDKPYRPLLDLFQHSHRFPVYCYSGIACRDGPGPCDSLHIGISDLQRNTSAIESDSFCAVFHAQGQKK